MAEKRMFSLKIIDSDAFLEMPLSAQALYFHLSMRADDDGFVNNPNKIKGFVGSNNDDMKLLIAKSFIIPFESGVIVIKHWRIHNCIQKDRYHPTTYTDEMAQLEVKENKGYTLKDGLYTDCIQPVSKMETQIRLDKSRLEKNRLVEGTKRASRFTPPTLEEVQAYCKERGNRVDAKKFFDYYNAGEWHDAKGNPVRNWKQKLLTWEKLDDTPQPVIAKRGMQRDTIEDDWASDIMNRPRANS